MEVVRAMAAFEDGCHTPKSMVQMGASDQSNENDGEGSSAWLTTSETATSAVLSAAKSLVAKVEDALPG